MKGVAGSNPAQPILGFVIKSQLVELPLIIMFIHVITYPFPDSGIDAILAHEMNHSTNQMNELSKEFARKYGFPRDGKYQWKELNETEKDQLLDAEDKSKEECPNPLYMSAFSYWLIRDKGFTKASVTVYTHRCE